MTFALKSFNPVENYKEHMMLFTVFTPVYNRRGLIHRVWDSLQGQTFRDFEWIVVDDGSTDNVIELLNKYKKKADFPVTVLQQENRGKHVAMNRAVEMAQGELFTELDSDDGCLPDSLEIFASMWGTLSAEQQTHCAGVGSLCFNAATGDVLGDGFPEENAFIRWLDLRYQHKDTGDKWWCVRTDLRKKYLLPEVVGATYFPERYYYSRISRKYDFLVVNKALKRVYLDAPFSLTRSPEPFRNSEAYYLSALDKINQESDYAFRYLGVLSIVRLWGGLWGQAFLSKQKIKAVFAGIESWLFRIFGLFFCLWDGCCICGEALPHWLLIGCSRGLNKRVEVYSPFL